MSDLSCGGWRRCSRETCAVDGEIGDFSAGDSLSERLCCLCQPREKETEILARHWTKSPCGSLTSMTSEVIGKAFRLPFLVDSEHTDCLLLTHSYVTNCEDICTHEQCESGTG